MPSRPDGLRNSRGHDSGPRKHDTASNWLYPSLEGAQGNYGGAVLRRFTQGAPEAIILSFLGAVADPPPLRKPRPLTTAVRRLTCHQSNVRRADNFQPSRPDVFAPRSSSAGESSSGGDIGCGPLARSYPYMGMPRGSARSPSSAPAARNARNLLPSTMPVPTVVQHEKNIWVAAGDGDLQRVRVRAWVVVTRVNTRSQCWTRYPRT